jgi:hypothetical protein
LVLKGSNVLSPSDGEVPMRGTPETERLVAEHHKIKKDICDLKNERWIDDLHGLPRKLWEGWKNRRKIKHCRRRRDRIRRTLQAAVHDALLGSSQDYRRLHAQGERLKTATRLGKQLRRTIASANRTVGQAAHAVEIDASVDIVALWAKRLANKLRRVRKKTDELRKTIESVPPIDLGPLNEVIDQLTNRRTRTEVKVTEFATAEALLKQLDEDRRHLLDNLRAKNSLVQGQIRSRVNLEVAKLLGTR